MVKQAQQKPGVFRVDTARGASHDQHWDHDRDRDHGRWHEEDGKHKGWYKKDDDDHDRD